VKTANLRPSTVVTLKDVSFDLHGFSHDRVIKANLSLSAKMFNEKIVEFEPVIEPVGVFAHIHQAAANKISASSPTFSTPCMTLTAGFTNTMDINLSKAMFQHVMETLELLSLLSNSETKTIDVTPYIVVNDTELTVCYRRVTPEVEDAEGKDVCKDEVSDEIIVPPYSSSPLTFANINPQKHLVQFRFQDFKWDPINVTIGLVQSCKHQVQYHLEGRRQSSLASPRDGRTHWTGDDEVDYCQRCNVRFELLLRKHHCRMCGGIFCAPCSSESVDGRRVCVMCADLSTTHSNRNRGGSFAVDFVFDVELVKGQKVLTIHSTMALENHTAQAYDVRLLTGPEGGQVAGENPPLGTVGPFQKMWLPLLGGVYCQRKNIAATMLVSIRPCATGLNPFEYQWSSPLHIKYPALDVVSLCVGQCEGKQAGQKSAVSFHFSACSFGIEEWRTAREKAKQSQVENAVLLDLNFEGVSEREIIKFYPNSTTLHIFDSLRVHNLLACGSRFRFLEMGRKTRSLSTLAELDLIPGQTSVVPACTPFQDLYLQCTLPELACGWSEPVQLCMSEFRNDYQDLNGDLVALGANKWSRTLSLQQKNDVLPVAVEVVFKEGSLDIFVFTPFWIFDLTSFGLVFSQDAKCLVPKRTKAALMQPVGSNVSPAADAKQFSAVASVSAPAAQIGANTDLRMCEMFNFFGPGKNPKLQLCAGAGWSAPFSIDKVGLSGQVSIPARGTDLNFDIGVRVETAPLTFYRTKIVTFVPRFVLLNSQSCPIEVKQCGTTTIFFIEPGKTLVFNSSLVDGLQPAPLALSFRRVGSEFSQWTWSGYFDIQQVGDTTINCPNLVVPEIKFARIAVRNEGASVFVSIGDYSPADPAFKFLIPFCVVNNSSEHVRLRQTPPDAAKGKVTALDDAWYVVSMYAWIHIGKSASIHLSRVVMQVVIVARVRRCGCCVRAKCSDVWMMCSTCRVYTS
jgi:hypothetical protein